MTPYQAWLVTEPLNARSKDFLPFGSILPPFFLFFAFSSPSSFVCPVVVFFFFFFFFFATGLRRPRTEEQRKKNSKDFLQLLRVTCPKQSIQRLMCWKCSGLWAPLHCSSPCQRALRLRKAPQTLDPVHLKPPSPRASSAHLQSPLLLFEWDYLPSLFEKQRPLQRMLQPLQDGGFISRPRLINPALFFFPLFPPHPLLVQLLPSCKVIPPGHWWHWKEKTCCCSSSHLVQSTAWTLSCPLCRGQDVALNPPHGTCTHESLRQCALGAAGGQPAPAEVSLEGMDTRPRHGWQQASVAVVPDADAAPRPSPVPGHQPALWHLTCCCTRVWVMVQAPHSG